MPDGGTSTRCRLHLGNEGRGPDPGHSEMPHLIDDQDPEQALFAFATAVKSAKADALIVHARKAWLKGLSPRENRDVPPLDYALVRRLKAAHPDLEIILNGGLASIEQAQEQVEGLDGVMMGRAAYQDP